MNLSTKKFIPGLILLALFSTSCEDPNELGLPMEPKAEVLVKELPLSTTNLLAEDYYTSNVPRLLVGNFSDTEFGKISASAFSQVRLTTASLKLNKDAIYDSIQIDLRTNYFHGNDLTSSKQLTVYRLEEAFSTDNQKVYKQSDTLKTAEIIGQGSFNLESPNQLISLRLNDAWGKSLLDKAKNNAPEFENNQAFITFFKGIALGTTDPNGGIIGFDRTHSASMIRLFYHMPGSTQPQEYTFAFNTTNNNNVKNFNRIIYKTEGTQWADKEKLKDFNTDNNKVYCQSGTGLIMKVNLDNYLKFILDHPKIIVQKADLLILDIEDQGDFIIPSSSLAIYPTNEENKFLTNDKSQVKVMPRQLPFLDQNHYGTDAHVLNFNQEKNHYLDQITFYLDHLARGKVKESDILLQPTNANTSVNRFSVSKENVKLKIYYIQAK
jgi:hypothetical protein